MQSKEWIAVISNAGHLPGQMRRELDDLIRGLAGKTLRISIEIAEKPRSNRQNRFYHGPFIKAFQACLLACGQRVSADDIHEGLRDAYAKNGYAIPLPNGESLRIPPSTKRLNTSGFEDFLEEIRAHFAEQFGWQLPSPNEIPIEAYEQVS